MDLQLPSVDALMTRQVETVTPDTALLTLRARMHTSHFHHLPVVEGGKLIGIVSDRDLLRALSPFLDGEQEQDRDVRTLVQEARDLMTPNPKTVTPETPLSEAAEVLLREDVSALPVVDGERLVGMITARDVLRFISQHATPDS